ncbi:MAG: sulfatase-like hydrolase/transferase [Verrucomicrobia bacterium]|jgi:arylsulfatase A-like enzyme|nr:sulfatase-like hydrolase/transferase [Verrucomicrobiota bacterium]
MPPNIVLILADDLGACDLGFYGNADASTPVLDALAGRSLRNEAFYVTPVCAPTRAALLTGRHHLRTGVAGVHGGKDHIHRSETLLPEVLKEAGYVSGIWGKWHSGTADGYLPHQRGFDESLVLRLYRHRDPQGSLNGGPRVDLDGEWGDDVIVDHALAFARRHRERPFFAFVSSMTPHGPLDAPEESVQRFMEERHLSRRGATLHAQLARFDAAIGRLLSGLEELDTNGRETMVLFLSDNGPAMFENDFTEAERARRNVLAWRGWKGDVWEAGIRTPLLLHRIGQTASAEVRQPADATDLLPTFAAWAGLDELPVEKPLDGRDLGPMLEGAEMPAKPVYTWVHPAIPPAPDRGEERRLQNEHKPLTEDDKQALDPESQVMALRMGDWKLVRNGDLNRPGGPWPATFLGNLTADPRETTDLHERFPDRHEHMEARLDSWFTDMKGEPHSFAPPQHRIPASGGASILASHAAYVGPTLYNSVPACEGFDRAGQLVRWSLLAEAPRQLRPELGWFRGGALPAGSRVALRSSGAEVTGHAGEGGTVTWDGSLAIDAGPGTLELEILAMPAPAAPLDLLLLQLRPE